MQRDQAEAAENLRTALQDFIESTDHAPMCPYRVSGPCECIKASAIEFDGELDEAFDFGEIATV